MKWLVIIATIVGISAVTFGLAYPASTHRFRLTVNVETPLGPRSGSSVMETIVPRQPGWFSLSSGTGRGYAYLDSGEAVFVDLGTTAEGRPLNLIALLAWGPRGTEPEFGDILRRAFFDYLNAKQQDRNRLLKNQRASSKEKASLGDCGDGEDQYCLIAQLPIGTKKEIRGKLIPTLIALRDIDDPNSALVVAPNSLHGVLGDGFRLRDITLELMKASSWPLSIFGMGGEPLTHVIEAKLPSIFKAFRTRSKVGSFTDKAGDPFVLRRHQLKVTQ